MLSIEKLTKIYGQRRVVNELDLKVEPGEIVGLLGPNGAGKTTTFHMICGLVVPDQGRIALEGNELTNLPMWRRARLGLAFLSQEPSVFRKLSVAENFQALLEFKYRSRDKIQEEIERLLKQFNLSERRDQKALSLSGGERRRVEIARAMISEPKFLLLDEPFTGIDPIARAELQDIIVALKKRSIGVLISDHNVRETLEITDRAYLIYDARVLISGTAQELINDPQARELYLGEKFKI
jgi:lipopolysaccharide export system ATP-binding protein